MKHLTYLVVALGLIWSGYWFYNARLEEQRISEWIRISALSVSVDTVQTRGFPNRLDTTLSGLKYQGFVGWIFPFVQVFRLVYASDHVVLAFPETAILQTADDDIALASHGWRASVITGPDVIESLVMEAEILSLSSAHFGKIDIFDPLLAIRSTDETELEFSLSARLQTSNTASVPPAFLRLHGTIGLDPWHRPSTGHAELASVNVDNGTISWGDNELRLNGWLNFGRRNHWIGDYRILSDDKQALTDFLVAFGLVDLPTEQALRNAVSQGDRDSKEWMLSFGGRGSRDVHLADVLLLQLFPTR